MVQDGEERQHRQEVCGPRGRGKPSPRVRAVADALKDWTHIELEALQQLLAAELTRRWRRYRDHPTRFQAVIVERWRQYRDHPARFQAVVVEWSQPQLEAFINAHVMHWRVERRQPEPWEFALCDIACAELARRNTAGGNRE